MYRYASNIKIDVDPMHNRWGLSQNERNFRVCTGLRYEALKGAGIFKCNKNSVTYFMDIPTIS